MQIPSKIDSLLNTSKHHKGYVSTVYQEIEPILEGSHLPFFPEYTDHGVRHIEGVLASAEALISDEAWTVFTPSDAAVLTLSVLFHDLAMHLSEDAFLILIKSANTRVLNPSDRSWPSLWQEFLSEAKRFDGKKLKEVFGDMQPVEEPPADPTNFTKRHRLLVGEFLRRHHARLAHEFAMYGLSGGDKGIKFDSIPQDILNIAGATARSHNEPLRALEAFLDNEYSSREYQGIHAVYIGALLRISDYLQLEAARAPEQLMRVRRLTSPISSREWNTHHAVRDIRTTHEDPEAIFVDALPKDISSYLRLRDVLRDIQAELDTTWATLGEVYGRYKNLNRLTLTVRRVRSSFDHPEELQKKLNYLAADARFRTAENDVLKLLIAPLYGERPEVGMRELLQNSIDSVLERLHVDVDFHLAEKDDDQDVLVEIRKTGERCSFTITDKGIGMDAEIVVSYFLRAGASFRKSSAWKNLFNDREGRSTVQRSGRFGVGVLAAFLLGDKIKVTTRRWSHNASEGLTFTASLEDQEIQIERATCDVGTRIEINISLKTYNKLVGNVPTSQTRAFIDWYIYDNPRVKLFFCEDDDSYAKKQRYKLKRIGVSEGWREFSSDGFDSIRWAYNRFPKLSCNGIIINSDVSLYGEDRHYVNLIRKPVCAVNDKDGLMPLNLQRTAMTTPDFPFSDRLKKEIAKEALDKAWSQGPNVPVTKAPNISWFVSGGYEGLDRDNRWDSRGTQGAYFCSRNGFGFVDPGIVNAAQLGCALIGFFTTTEAKYPIIDLEEGTGAFVYVMKPNIDALLDFLRALLEAKPSSLNGSLNYFDKFISKGARVAFSKNLWSNMKMFDRLPAFLQRGVSVDDSNENYTLISYRECPSAAIEIPKIIECGMGESYLMFAELYLQPGKQMGGEPTQISEVWSEMVGNKLFPYER